MHSVLKAKEKKCRRWRCSAKYRDELVQHSADEVPAGKANTYEPVTHATHEWFANKQSDADLDRAVSIAAMIAPYRHVRLSAMKLAGDPNAPLLPENMTLEQLRADIVAEVARLGHILELDAVREPQGIENRPSPGPTNGEGEAE